MLHCDVRGRWKVASNFDLAPRGPGEASQCREAKNCRKTILPLNYRAIIVTAGATLKEEKKSSLAGEGQFGRHFKRQFG